MRSPRYQLIKGTEVEINFGIRSELAYLQEASNVLADLLVHTPLTDLQIDKLKLAVMEMGWNAIEWGHCRNSDLVPRITSRIDPTSITLTIQDQGPGFNPRNPPHAASDEDPIGHLSCVGSWRGGGNRGARSAASVRTRPPISRS
jgi:two-component system OmpR family response regulator